MLCLGAGCFFYALVCISILQSSHLATPAENYKGQPALFLGEPANAPATEPPMNPTGPPMNPRPHRVPTGKVPPSL